MKVKNTHESANDHVCFRILNRFSIIAIVN